MKLLVTGDRNWKKPNVILENLKILQGRGYTTVVEGGALGADTDAREAAKILGMTYIEVPAEWRTFGKKAGMMRNRKMLKDHPDIDLVLAFHDDLRGRSRGTKGMVNLAVDAGICVLHFNSRGEVSVVVGRIE